ncbi:hypothetical protein FOZ60_004503 [Perkinsus olseni]|uniref:GTP-binding protein 10 n=1 Tax=Perkinsus olseni TaxID=32597 RepID=A0A7J6PNB7_PEROL|nr:hypothetical protein FOZ60_004503 [Perkinsus olseni]
MINRFSIWFLCAGTLVISTAQDVGRFAFEYPFVEIFYDVNEEKEVTLTFDVPRRILDAHRVGKLVSGHHELGPYPLRKKEGSTYTIDFENSGITSGDWDQSVETFSRNTGILPFDSPYYPGDLTTLTYVSGDSFSVNFHREELLFLRLERRLTEYIYKEPVSPHMRISYKIYENGMGGVLVKCKRRSTSRFPHMLSPRDRGLPHLSYAVESAGQGTLDQFLYQVRYVCRHKHVSPNDFSRVVFATERTIYVEFERGRLALTKV